MLFFSGMSCVNLLSTHCHCLMTLNTLDLCIWQDTQFSAISATESIELTFTHKGRIFSFVHCLKAQL